MKNPASIKEFETYIPCKFPSLNDYIRECRGNKYQAAHTKRAIENYLMLYLARAPVLEGPVYLSFHWIEKGKKRDPDNIAFAKKFVLDALVKGGHIPNDTARYIAGFSDTFAQGAEYGLRLHIKEV